MVEPLIALLILILVVGIVAWFVTWLIDMLPMEGRFRQIAKAIVLVIAVLIILVRALGVLGYAV